MRVKLLWIRIADKIVSITNWISERIIRLDEFTIVTATDQSHFCSLVQLINSIRIFYPKHKRIVLFDLGLSEDQLLRFERMRYGIEIIRFPFEKYPPHLEMKRNAGSYGWKPIVIEETMRRFKGMILYLDTACFVTNGLYELKINVLKHGVSMGYSVGSIADYTSEETLKILAVPDAIRGKRMIFAGAIALNCESSISKHIISDWSKFCLNERLICPPYASRENHRWDQSLLSILIHSDGNLSRTCVGSMKGIVMQTGVE